MGVKHSADRFRHARGFWSCQRIGHGAAHELVHLCEVGGHEPGGKRLVAGLTGSLEMQAHFHEKHAGCQHPELIGTRSEEHTSELQSPMRISYAVSCWKKNTTLIFIIH